MGSLLGWCVYAQHTAFFMTTTREQLLNMSTAKAAYAPTDLLSSGSTLLNLACSGHWQGGWLRGSYVYLVGDSQSGKTFFALTCMAEACINPAFKDYRLIYDAVERGAKMDLAKFFGAKMAGRVEPPAWTVGDDGKKTATPSDKVEDFYFNIDDALQGDRPFIYVLDSMDGLDSKYGLKKFQEAKVAHRGNKKAKGDFGDGKAKENSRNIRRVAAACADHGSILIVVSQTRDNIDAGMFEAKQTRSGGRALKFYADTEVWTSVGAAISKEYKEKKIKLGGIIRATVKKNRLNGRERTVTIPIYYDHGFDDVGSCVDYLVEWKHWPKKKGGYIKATLGDDLWEFTAQREALILEIIADGLQQELSEEVAKVWHDIEAKVAVVRENKYE